MFKWTLLTIILFACLSVTAYGQPFRTDQQAYEYGYHEGYEHGSADNDAGLTFDYHHSHQFRSGISYNSYVNSQFRSGYADGYRDGFYRDSANYRDEDDYYHDGDRDDDDHDYDYDRDDPQYGEYNSNHSNGGFVTVFTDDRFNGSHVSFRSGQYPYLNGRLHNAIDSIELRGPVRVILFDKPNFRGKQIVIQRDMFDLDDYDFGDKAESMIVQRIY